MDPATATAAAGAISTYGAYFIAAVLGIACSRLFLKIGAVEKEFRDYMAKDASAKSEAHTRLIADCTAALNASTAALKDSAAAMDRIAAAMDAKKD